MALQLSVSDPLILEDHSLAVYCLLQADKAAPVKFGLPLVLPVPSMLLLLYTFATLPRIGAHTST